MVTIIVPFILDIFFSHRFSRQITLVICFSHRNLDKSARLAKTANCLGTANSKSIGNSKDQVITYIIQYNVVALPRKISSLSLLCKNELVKGIKQDDDFDNPCKKKSRRVKVGERLNEKKRPKKLR